MTSKSVVFDGTSEDSVITSGIASKVASLLTASSIRFGIIQPNKKGWLLPVEFPRTFQAVTEVKVAEKVTREFAPQFSISELLEIENSEEFRKAFGTVEFEGETYLRINGKRFAQSMIDHEHTRGKNAGFTWSKFCEIRRKAVADFARDGKIDAGELLGRRAAKPVHYSLPSATGISQAERDAVKKLTESAPVVTEKAPKPNK